MTPDSRTLYLRLLSYVRPYAKIFALAVLGMMLTAATEPLFPALIKPLLDGGFASAGGSAWPPAVFAAAIIGIFLLRGILTFTSSYCMTWVAQKVVLDLRSTMFTRLVRLPAKFFDDNASGRLLSKVAYDVTNTADAATGALTVLIKDSIAVIGLLAYLFYTNWKLTLVTLVIAPPIALTVALISRRLRRMARGAQSSLGDLVHVLQETIDCHKVVKVFGGQEYESRRFAKSAQTVRGFYMRINVAAALTTPITHTLVAFALAVIIYMAMQDALAGRVTVGEFASFMTAMLMLLAPLKHLTEVNTVLQRGLAAAESVFGLIDTPVEDDSGKTVLGRARGELRLERVNFTYPTRTEPALAGIELEVHPGETVALVGGSGGGKTTLVNMLPRFYAPDAGRILLDGHDIQSLTLDSLRANIALVSQEVVLFNDSIQANIAYGRMGGASEAEVIAAAEAAHAMSFIRETPDGLKTLIGENGMRLSGGQRQRLAIARALLKNAPLLLLDEATSALDSESERQVQAALDTLMRGRIVESGRHAELLALDGAYARLHRMQYAAERAAA